MKLSFRSFAALSIAASSCALAQSFIGNANPTNGQSGVFAYWNFNALSITTASAPGAGGVPTTIASDFGSASLSLSSWTGLVDDFGGSTLNAQSSAPSEESLSLVSNAGNGSFIQFSFSMANLTGLVINFDRRGTSTGFSTGQWSYSQNGSTFTNFGSNTATTSTSFATVTPSVAITTLDNDSTVFLRYTLSGATNTSGNNRIDNVTLSATYSAIPEPSTFGAILGVAALAGVAARRRRSV